LATGFTFGGVHSDAFSIIVNKKDIPLTPPIENRLQEISGHDGAWDYGISYGAKPIEIECTILAESKDDLKAKARRLAGILNPRKGVKPLIFDDEPDVQYFARLANQLPLDQLGAMGTFTIQFTCPDPFTYSVNERRGTFSNDLRTTHNGAHEAKPKLTVTHGGGSGSIKNTRPDGIVETITFTEDSPAGTYEIDCKEMTITVDGKAGYNFVKGDFLTLPEGENLITNSGGVSSVSILYRDTWL